MLTEYLRELHNVELLVPAVEGRLWRAYKRRGDLRSRARLIEAYQPLVFKVAMQLRLREALLMDMIQEGTVGLIQAVERFDPDRGVRFSTFATYRIRGRILNALRRERGRTADLEDTSESFARIPDPAAADALASVEDGVLVRQIVSAIDGLPARERRILRGAFLAAEEPSRIAGELKISLSHFYRLQQQALRRIRDTLMPAPFQPSGASE
ncbi:MAG TPA: sigma-70 family RNA polymerase sigma factor [bacterium]|nr:sigma-70 family RNA polymerase sigma factor [bacterium]